jgi:hypothetical protein
MKGTRRVGVVVEMAGLLEVCTFVSFLTIREIYSLCSDAD